MPFWKENKTWRSLIIVIIAIFSIYLLYLARSLFFSFALAVLISYLLNPLVNAITKKGMSRVWGILFAYLALFFITAAIFMYGIPRIVSQLNTISETVPYYTAQVQEITRSIQSRYTGLGIPLGVRQVIDERIQWVEEIILKVVSDSLAAIVGTLGYIFKILLAPVLSFYILKDIDLIKKRAISAIPQNWREEAVELFREIDKVLGSFVRGYLLIAAIVGGMTAAAMAALGVEFALMLGIFAGLAEIIPYFGPIIGAVPAVGLAILKSKWLAVKVAIAFLVIHQVEGNIISPKILGDKVGLHPLVVIFSLLAGGELYGLPGMLLAVPVAAMLKVIVRFALQKAKVRL
ncbi:MAG: AI-2E family transporter [Desulfotomaculaceae bacterium]|nr:AI-2E family transporter [Desulfotomaculaceae bacterium]